VQGDSATLSWQGNAVNYSVSDGTSTFNVGPRRSLVVRPATNAAYTLQAVGPGGTSTAGDSRMKAIASSAPISA